jgi:hypothetical protein
MTFYDVSQLHQDTQFVNRIAACYAIETPLGEGENPEAWSTWHSWDIAAAPGFGDAYGFAVANGNPEPGKDPSVITDEQLLSAVQAVIAAETPPAA